MTLAARCKQLLLTMPTDVEKVVVDRGFCKQCCDWLGVYTGRTVQLCNQTLDREFADTGGYIYLLSLEQTFSEFCWVLRRLSQFEGDSIKDSIS